MIKVLFFAQLREVLECSDVIVEAVPDTVGDLRSTLQEKSETWAEWLVSEKTLVAVNQTIANDNVSLKAGDDVAFFPPVTGG